MEPDLQELRKTSNERLLEAPGQPLGVTEIIDKKERASKLFQKGLAAYEKKDYRTALREWKLAAEQGHATAQYNLGFMYGNGLGVPKNYVYAYMWDNIAASQGDKDAAKARDLLAKEMTRPQIAEAQKLASECVKRKYKGCD